MDDERLLELARDPDTVPGIYNYCDRWCERCDQQSKCLVFAVEQEQKASGGDSWKSIQERLRSAQKLLVEKMEEFGLDPEEVEGKDKDEARLHEDVRAHPLVRQAEQYAFGTAAYLEPLQDALASEAGSLEHKIELGITPTQGLTLEDLEPCRVAFETILHFRFLICGKVFRAVSGMADEGNGPDPYMAEDARLSAQVAWKGIQRSIEAWLTLRRALPGGEAGILEMLLQLDRIRRDAEAMFPGSADPERRN